MKKIFLVLLASLMLFSLVSCDNAQEEKTASTEEVSTEKVSTEEVTTEKVTTEEVTTESKSADEETYTFCATVLEIDGESCLVAPYGEPALPKTVWINGIDPKIGAIVGCYVKVTHNGVMMPSEPPQMNALGCTVQDSLEYAGDWLNKENAVPFSGKTFDTVIIQEIHPDYFLGYCVLYPPYIYRINGDIGSEWCIGDQVDIEFTNVFKDKSSHKYECDLVSIELSDLVLDPDLDAKPVIYLYPEKDTEVSVKLTLDGKLTCTYPDYGNGWTVTASPDGTLTDARGQIYNYLYWEGETYAKWDMSKGFCVKGEDTAAFLEHALAALGLNRREANEFIVYWLPLMQNNPYNIISFQTEVYTESARLEICPEPDTLIRVFMAYMPSDIYIDIPPQVLQAAERVGFTVVEWGGTMVN